ncbi:MULTISPECIES: ribosome maturation factor RimM [unclassified Paludibacterium]|uniref:ribosome maturation factor RimM n=1 Tax=unclassified Paludibacterium TaxID=2618429 RepID=UPI001C03CDFD|nr:ribosome maturation factor RimM [Paludibacterium sp. B53371]BEV72104.1 ribosome maturation factor RimM [Paludibacterium sp. THUN1379]
MRDNDLVIMGFVRGAFGVRGGIKVHADTEFVDSLFDYPVWWLGRNGDWKPYNFVDGQVQPKALVAQLEGVTDRDVAEAMRGMQIAVPRSELPEAEEDEYYWNDLIGLKVNNLEGESFGSVTELMETGANDVLVVDDGPKRRLIPFVDAVIDRVDLEAGLIVVDWGADY